MKRTGKRTPLSHCPGDKRGVKSTKREVVEEGHRSLRILHVQPVWLVEELTKAWKCILKLCQVYFEGTPLSVNNPHQRKQWSRSSVPWTTPSQTPRRQVRRGNWWQGSSSSRAPGKEWVSFQSFYFNPKTLFLGDLRNLHLILQGAHSAFHKAKPSLTAE